MHWFVVIAAYLLGTIPFGVIFAKSRGVDVRTAGSGNIGATNVGRTVGKTAGVLTLVCDILKGLLPVAVAQWAGLPPGWVATACLAAILGHIYSPWLMFRGGKGVATAAGVFLAGAPLAAVIGLLGFVVAVKISKRVSVGSLVGVIILPFALWLLGAAPQMTAAGAITALIIIQRHKENIQRLRTGTESKLGGS
jgi:glycerol-3-phosphate acyltransferase PlsY